MIGRLSVPKSRKVLYITRCRRVAKVMVDSQNAKEWKTTKRNRDHRGSHMVDGYLFTDPINTVRIGGYCD